MNQIINVGIGPDTGTGDKLRDAFIIVNDNFASIDTLLSGNDVLTISQITGLQTALNNIQTQLDYIPGLQSDINSINNTIYTINQTLNSQNASIADLYDEITNLQTQIYTKVEEAPIDGNSYVRRDATWTILSGNIGATGATGPQGIQGITGSQGPQGATGATGPAPDTSIFVPYIGATDNVNLGSFNITSTQFNFTGLTNSGRFTWNDVDGTADLTLKGGNVTLQVGQEQLVRVVNKTATNITLQESAYQAVRITGAQDQRLKVDLALATTDALSAETIGLVTETIANNQEGFVTISGLVNKINTTGSLQGETWNDGDILYLSPTTAGRITNIKPSAPDHMVIIGYVVYAHSNNGKIFVKVNNGYELDELHNVNITGATAGQVLQYNGTSSIWENKTIVEDVIVNGVTSRAPSQNAVFDAFTLRKRQIVNDSVTSTVTGTTTPTIVKSYQFLPGTLTLSGFLEMYLLSIRTGLSVAHTMNVFINTTNSLSGATLIGGANTPGNFSPVFPMKLFFVLKDNLIVGGLVNQSTMTNLPTSAGSVSAPCNNTINSVWILVTITPGSTTQVIGVQGVEIIN